MQHKELSSASELHMLRGAIEATRSAIIITDSLQKDDPIVYANKAFLSLTGYSKKDVLGKNCRFLQGKDTNPEDIDKIRHAIKQQIDVQVTIRNYKKDGTPFWNDLIMSPVFSGKTLTHFIGLQLDITDRIEYERELEESRSALTSSNLELEQFTYAASHDLQEPLRMVSSFLQLLEQKYDDKLDTKGKEYIAFAVNGAERMRGLIQDLLVLSRLRTVRQPSGRVKLSSLIDDALFNLKASIDETGATVSQKGTDIDIMAEKIHMMQALQNLIGNAIKYHAPGVAPCVSVTAEDRGAHVTIGVEDNGIGIPEKQFERIFGVFQRLHTRGEYSGSGIGLSLCKKVIEQHGGSISVSSTVGKGSKFVITLPNKEAA